MMDFQYKLLVKRASETEEKNCTIAVKSECDKNREINTLKSC